MWLAAVSLSFATTGSREITYSYDLNQPIPSPTLYINAPRPFPNLPNIPYYTNGAGHEYRAGTLQVKHSFTKGLWFQAYYTLAGDIGDIDIDGSVENAFNRQRDVGVWSNPPTNRFYANMIYDFADRQRQTLPARRRPLAERDLWGAGRWPTFLSVRVDSSSPRSGRVRTQPTRDIRPAALRRL